MKTWLENKLGLPDLKEEVSSLKRRSDNLKWELSVAEKRIKVLEDLVQVGADINPYGESWAVVCVNGKTEYVNFIRLRSEEAQEIFRFLKHFEHKCFDASHGMMRNLW